MLEDLELFISNWKSQNTFSSVIHMMDAYGDSLVTQLQNFFSNTAPT